LANHHCAGHFQNNTPHFLFESIQHELKSPFYLNDLIISKVTFIGLNVQEVKINQIPEVPDGFFQRALEILSLTPACQGHADRLHIKNFKSRTFNFEWSMSNNMVYFPSIT